MRLLRVLAPTLVVALAVAGVASATVRGGMASVAASAEDVLAAVTDPTPSPSPSAEPSAEPSAVPSAEPSGEPSGEPAPESTPTDEPDDANHGAAVSAVARDKDAVATWVNPAGKEITNHGKAVSAVARSDAGKPHAEDDAEAGGGHGTKDK